MAYISYDNITATSCELYLSALDTGWGGGVRTCKWYVYTDGQTTATEAVSYIENAPYEGGNIVITGLLQDRTYNVICNVYSNNALISSISGDFQTLPEAGGEENPEPHPPVVLSFEVKQMSTTKTASFEVWGAYLEGVSFTITCNGYTKYSGVFDGDDCSGTIEFDNYGQYTVEIWYGTDGYKQTTVTLSEDEWRLVYGTELELEPDTSSYISQYVSNEKEFFVRKVSCTDDGGALRKTFKLYCSDTDRFEYFLIKTETGITGVSNGFPLGCTFKRTSTHGELQEDGTILISDNAQYIGIRPLTGTETGSCSAIIHGYSRYWTYVSRGIKNLTTTETVHYSLPVASKYRTGAYIRINVPGNGTLTISQISGSNFTLYISNEMDYDDTTGTPDNVICTSINGSPTMQVSGDRTYYYLHIKPSSEYVIPELSFDMSFTEMAGITKWSWTASNGSATVDDTVRAYAAVTTKGFTSDFSCNVWNDMVDKVTELALAENDAWYENYDTVVNTKMTSSDEVLTAKMFNSLRFNIGARENAPSTGIEEKKQGNIVEGWFFTKLTECINSWIDNM